jgi:hypothetical protein
MGVIFLPCKDSPPHERGSIRGITNQIMRVTREIKTRALRMKIIAKNCPSKIYLIQVFLKTQLVFHPIPSSTL